MDSIQPIPTTAQAPSALPRSTFVTVVAWIFIVGGGFGLLIAVFQAVMLTFMMPDAKFWSGPADVRGLERMPSVIRFMIGNVPVFFVAMWLLIGCTLAAAIGLLKRKNWARLYFVVVLSLGILWTLGGIALQHTMMSAFSDLPNGASPAMQRHFEGMRTAMLIANIVYSVVIVTLFGWIVKRLVSRAVRVEFNAL